jgi:hypothetical protein
MGKQIVIEVRDGKDVFACTVKRPDVATLSRVTKLLKTDEVLAMQELLKGCWVDGDTQILNDALLLMAAANQMGGLQSEIAAEIKN